MHTYIHTNSQSVKHQETGGHTYKQSEIQTGRQTHGEATRLIQKQIHAYIHTRSKTEQAGNQTEHTSNTYIHTYNIPHIHTYIFTYIHKENHTE